jgi:hypothetical protein
VEDPERENFDRVEWVSWAVCGKAPHKSSAVCILEIISCTTLIRIVSANRLAAACPLAPHHRQGRFYSAFPIPLHLVCPLVIRRSESALICGTNVAFAQKESLILRANAGNNQWLPVPVPERLNQIAVHLTDELDGYSLGAYSFAFAMVRATAKSFNVVVRSGMFVKWFLYNATTAAAIRFWSLYLWSPRSP